MYRTTIIIKNYKRKKTVPLSSWMGPKILIMFGMKEFFHKIWPLLPAEYSQLLKSYLPNRYLRAKTNQGSKAGGKFIRLATVPATQYLPPTT